MRDDAPRSLRHTTVRRLGIAAAALSAAFVCSLTPVRGEEPELYAESFGPLTVRIGVEQYAPLAFFDEHGVARGVAIEVLSAVARQRNWRLEFVAGEFGDLLRKLDLGAIDVLPTIARSPEREQRYRFTERPYLTNWGVVYQRTGAGIAGLLDLADQHVAVVSGDTHGDALMRRARDFDFAFFPVVVGGFGAALDAVESGLADAAVVSRLFAVSAEHRRRDVVATPIVLNPVNLHFAGPLAGNPAVLAAIDRYLADAVADPGSAYNRAIDAWLRDPAAEAVPEWVWIALSAFGGAIVVVALLTVVSRVQVRRRTRELRYANEKLRQTGQRLERILDSLADGILIVDADDSICFANACAGSYLLSDPEEIVGRTFGVRTAAGTATEAELSRSDRSVLPVEIRASEIEYRGEPCRLLAVRDISERRRAERHLQEQEGFIRAILDNVTDAILTIDSDGSVVSVNPSTERIFGYTADEIVGRNVSLLMPERARDATGTQLLRYLSVDSARAPGARLRELAATRKDGKTVPIELSVSEMQRHGRRLFVGTVRDISERKRAEAELREKEQRFRSAFESAGHGIALVGLDGRYLQVNQALCEITGYPQDELLTLTSAAVVHPDDLEADEAGVRALLAGATDFHRTEIRYARRDGSAVPVWVSRGLVRAVKGEPLYSVVHVVDLSERRRAEEQLVQAQKMETVGHLTGGIAHDFNNILTVILGNLQLGLRRTKDDKRLREQLDRALGATRRGAELTKRLLAFSRRQVLEPKTIDLNALLDDLMPLLSRTLGTNVEIETHYAAVLPPITIDVSQVENAVLNLCVNSRDAMRDGGRLIIETTVQVLDESYARSHGFVVAPGRYVLLSISDTGSGMSEETKRRVFEPFYTTKEAGKGTGLGMSMVYGFVKQSGGHINVYSELGSGTTIKIYLPAGAPGTVAESRDDSAPVADLRGTERVLLVDDDTDVRKTLAAVLEVYGYHVIEAEDGPAALALLAQGTAVDVLVTDVIMPGGLNGPALVRLVRERHPDLPVIIQSGYSERMIVPAEMLDERTGYLAKPFADETLARKMREILEVRTITDG